MTDFIFSAAGVKVGVSALYPTTRDFFKDFTACSPADFSFNITEKDVELERIKSAETDKKSGVPVREFDSRYLETLAVLRKTADRLPEYNALLFHGSVAAYKGKAYLFAAPSGTGKTTHTRLLLDRYKEAYILNGDKPFLKVTDGCVYACPSPFKGKEGFGVNEALPLAAICFLERNAQNSIEPISLKEAFLPMINQIHKPENAEGMLKITLLCEKIGKSVSLYRLKCNKEKDAAAVSGGVLFERG